MHRELKVLAEPLEVQDSKDHKVSQEILVLRAQLVRRARRETLANPERLERPDQLVLPEILDPRDQLEIQGVQAETVHKVRVDQRVLLVHLVTQASQVHKDKLAQQVHQEIKDWLVQLDQWD